MFEELWLKTSQLIVRHEFTDLRLDNLKQDKFCGKKVCLGTS